MNHCCGDRGNLTMPYLTSLPENAGPPNLFKRYPDIYRPWAEMSEALMNGPSPLSRGERELVLAYAAGVAGCEFVSMAHAEVAYAHDIENGLVQRLLDDFEAAKPDNRLRPLLSYVRKLSVDPASVVKADVDAVLSAGWDEQAVHDVAAITARAAFMQRLVQGHGFNVPTLEVVRKHAQRRVEQGYVNLYRAFRDSQTDTR